MFKAYNKPKLNLYVDMAAMYDYRLTALLNMCKVEAEYDYIKKKLPKYALYKGRKITTVFPALKFTEEQVEAYLRDPNNVTVLSEASLITNITNLIPSQLFMFNWVNKQSPLYENEPINIYFVNEYFLPTERSALKIDHGLKKLYPNTICHFRNQKINEEPESLLATIDHFILDDIKSFTAENTITYKMLIAERRLFGSAIYASHRFEDHEPWMDDDGQGRIDRFEELMNHFCYFMSFDKLLLEHTKDINDLAS